MWHFQLSAKGKVYCTTWIILTILTNRSPSWVPFNNHQSPKLCVRLHMIVWIVVHYFVWVVSVEWFLVIKHVVCSFSREECKKKKGRDCWHSRGEFYAFTMCWYFILLYFSCLSMRLALKGCPGNRNYWPNGPIRHIFFLGPETKASVYYIRNK